MDAISIDAIQSLIKIPMTLLRCSTSAAITTATCTPPTNLQAEVAEQGVKPRLQGCKGVQAEPGREAGLLHASAAVGEAAAASACLAADAHAVAAAAAAGCDPRVAHPHAQLDAAPFLLAAVAHHHLGGDAAAPAAAVLAAVLAHAAAPAAVPACAAAVLAAVLAHAADLAAPLQAPGGDARAACLQPLHASFPLAGGSCTPNRHPHLHYLPLHPCASASPMAQLQWQRCPCHVAGPAANAAAVVEGGGGGGVAAH
eukprot:1159166-Pelagomonas_calceolata.AAC.1